jgi:hypothetical protein
MGQDAEELANREALLQAIKFAMFNPFGPFGRKSCLACGGIGNAVGQMCVPQICNFCTRVRPEGHRAKLEIRETVHGQNVKRKDGVDVDWSFL